VFNGASAGGGDGGATTTWWYWLLLVVGLALIAVVGLVFRRRANRNAASRKAGLVKKSIVQAHDTLQNEVYEEQVGEDRSYNPEFNDVHVAAHEREHSWRKHAESAEPVLEEVL
jgi:hypothetical protein